MATDTNLERLTLEYFDTEEFIFSFEKYQNYLKKNRKNNESSNFSHLAHFFKWILLQREAAKIENQVTEHNLKLIIQSIEEGNIETSRLVRPKRKTVQSGENIDEKPFLSTKKPKVETLLAPPLQKNFQQNKNNFVYTNTNVNHNNNNTIIVNNQPENKKNLINKLMGIINTNIPPSKSNPLLPSNPPPLLNYQPNPHFVPQNNNININNNNNNKNLLPSFSTFKNVPLQNLVRPSNAPLPPPHLKPVYQQPMPYPNNSNYNTPLYPINANNRVPPIGNFYPQKNFNQVNLPPLKMANPQFREENREDVHSFLDFIQTGFANVNNSDHSNVVSSNEANLIHPSNNQNLGSPLN